MIVRVLKGSVSVGSCVYVLSCKTRCCYWSSTHRCSGVTRLYHFLAKFIFSRSPEKLLLSITVSAAWCSL